MKAAIKYLIRILRNALLPVEFTAKYFFLNRMSMAFARGAANKSNILIDSMIPSTWEFSSFSQNGEDGIVDFLLNHIKTPDRYFIEIGSSDGLENNSSYLAFVKKYSGLMIEGDYAKSYRAKKYLQSFNWGVKYLNAFITKDNIASIIENESVTQTPDYFSLDIDGIDYYVMDALFKSKFRPKIVCVEYNSSFGPAQSVTIKYQSNFNYWKAHPSHFYYGVSICGWRSLFKKHNYDFVSVDLNGVNGFFIDRTQFKDTLSAEFNSLDFVENFALRSRYKNTYLEQFGQIKNLEYHEIGV